MGRATEYYQIPQVPSSADKDVQTFLKAVKGTLDVFTGSTGNANANLDQVVTFRDIQNLYVGRVVSSTSRPFSGRITRVTGDVIRTGRIECNDATSFLDLTYNKLVFNNKITYDSTEPGIFIGQDQSDKLFKVNIGHDASGYSIKWNGSTLVITGTITATAGAIGGFVITVNGISDNATEADAKIFLDKPNTMLRLGPTTGTYLVVDGDYSGIPAIYSSNYSAGTSGFLLKADLLDVGNILARGSIRCAVFQKDSVSAVGGNLAILAGDVLAADMTSGGTTLTIKGDETFVVGDALRIKEGTDDEWLQVTDASSAPTYSVTRDKASVYSGSPPAWKKGASVINYRQSGDGGILLTSSMTNAPYFSVFTHAGSPWSAITERIRVGNLNGFLDYASDLYGIGIGDTSGYLKYDPTNGLRVLGAMTDTTAWENKTSDFNAVTGGRYFVTTTGGAVTMTLPSSPTVGNRVRWMDLASSFGTYALTIARNGEKIMGYEDNLVCQNNDESGILEYTGSSYGWVLF